MTPKEQHARAEIDRISQIPLRQRTQEDRHNWDIAILQRDFSVMDADRERSERETELVCARIKKGYLTRD